MARSERTSTRAAGAAHRAKALVFSAVAVAAGAASVVVLHGVLGQYQQAIAEARQPEETVMVMVAARDLYQGITIEEGDLYAVEIPPRFLPENVFLSPDHVVGRVPSERILANEFLRADRLSDPESGRGMNAVIPRGLRAMSVNLADGRALAGFLEPGTYVDVLVTMAPEEERSQPVTRTILQAVFVLGVNSRMGDETAQEARDARGAHRPTVTLLVTPEQSEDLAFAEAMGELTLAMRTNEDLDLDLDLGGGVTLGELRRVVQGIPAAPRVRSEPPPPACGVFTIYKGADGKSYCVDADGVIR